MVRKSLEQKIQYLIDIHEIQKVMHKHAYYHNALMHKEEFDEIWAKKQSDLRWAANEIIWEGGWEELRKMYVGHLDEDNRIQLEAMSKLDPSIKNVKENLGMGHMTMHPLTTPIIEIAEDGETAKGVWISAGQVTFPIEGRPVAHWAFEKYGVDFIREDGDWKIWHCHTYVDFYCPVGVSWVDNPKNFTDKSSYPNPTRIVPVYDVYTPKRVSKYVPKPPKPYKTFDEKDAY